MLFCHALSGKNMFRLNQFYHFRLKYTAEDRTRNSSRNWEPCAVLAYRMQVQR
jgi:hypothetical protein